MRTHRVTALVVASFMASGVAFADAEEDFFATPTLLAHVREGRVQAAEEMLFARAFDGWTLGRALLDALTANDASSRGERDAFRLANLLLAKGADPAFADGFGRTPLMEASRKRYETVVHLLLDAGADVAAQDDAGRDALDYAAAAGGDTATVTWLLETARDRRASASNVRVSVRDGRVEVLYDLSAPAPVGVALRGATGAGGRPVAVRAVSGEVGANVAPGKNRKVVWSVLDDHPQGFGDDTVSLEVVVSSGR